MGYCIEKEEGQIKIKKENMDKVLKTLSDFFKNGGKLRWVDGFNLNEMIAKDECDEPKTLEDIWDDLRYGLKETEDYYIIEDFYGEKLGNDLELFKLIAQYCEDGYLQFAGDDGDHFRIVIKDGKADEKWATISWEE